MILMLVTYQLKTAGTGRAFYEALVREDVIARTRAEDGCENYQFYAPQERDDQIFLLEAWENAEKMAAHKKTPQCQTLQELKAQFVQETSFSQYQV